MTQLDTTLRALRERGDRGVHTHELRSGLFGECIANPSERIARLEKCGHTIAVSAKEPLHGKALGVRYTLVLDAEQALGDGLQRGGPDPLVAAESPPEGRSRVRTPPPGRTAGGSSVGRAPDGGDAPAEHLFGADEYRRGHWDEAA